MFFMMICGNEEKVEIFEGFFVPELEWMISWVTFFFLQGVLVLDVIVAAKTKNSLCFILLRWRLALFHPVTRVDSRVARRSSSRGFKDRDLARSLPRIVDP